VSEVSRQAAVGSQQAASSAAQLSGLAPDLGQAIARFRS
jgi:methyl-accepting chemotaxis protein